jgi:hypothetical protein
VGVRAAVDATDAAMLAATRTTRRPSAEHSPRHRQHDRLLVAPRAPELVELFVTALGYVQGGDYLGPRLGGPVLGPIAIGTHSRDLGPLVIHFRGGI